MWSIKNLNLVLKKKKKKDIFNTNLLELISGLPSKRGRYGSWAVLPLRMPRFQERHSHRLPQRQMSHSKAVHRTPIQLHVLRRRHERLHDSGKAPQMVHVIRKQDSSDDYLISAYGPTKDDAAVRVHPVQERYSLGQDQQAEALRNCQSRELVAETATIALHILLLPMRR